MVVVATSAFWHRRSSVRSGANYHCWSGALASPITSRPPLFARRRGPPGPEGAEPLLIAHGKWRDALVAATVSNTNVRAFQMLKAGRVSPLGGGVDSGAHDILPLVADYR